MAVNFMDNFNIYGTDAGRAARMLNGVYAETTRADLQVDPDPTAGGGQVLRKFPGGLGGDCRKVINTARVTVGAAARIWFTSLPPAPGDGECPTMFSFRDVNNLIHVDITIDPSGNIVARRQDAGVQVQLGITANPVIVANAWKHIEAKVKIDNAVGTVEVRVEGITVLNLAGIDTFTNQPGAVASIQQVAQKSAQDGGAAPTMYVKDYIIWDTTGAFNNDFMGSCQVLKIIPDADVALNWTPVPGPAGYNMINLVTPADDVNYISAAAPGIPAAYKCSLSDLPVTVTSVRAIMPVHRSRKTDGGDGNIQIGAISGASTGLGADRPITTAYTYWYDVFDADPNGNVAWSRVSVNNLNLQINRTL
jgi:hypothetical protein